MVDDVVVESERAHSGSLLGVGLPVGAGRGCPFDEWPLVADLRGRLQVVRTEVVLADSGLPLFLAETGLEVVVEVAAV